MKKLVFALAATLAMTLLAPARAQTKPQTIQVPPGFLAETAKKYQLDPAWLQTTLAKAQYQQAIIDAISKPAEGVMPWHRYRKIFLTPERIDKGVAFWANNAALIEQAAQTHQVDPQIIVAILGVETYYGQRMGSWKVLDALATLGFHYPPRSQFFSGELAQYLKLAHDEGWDIDKRLGSYAGAMGQGQFIPSSYRHYSVDFDGDGHRDLFHNNADAIGSVANYFSQHHWRQGQPVATQAQAGSIQNDWIKAGYKPHKSLAHWKKLGVNAPGFDDPEREAALVPFTQESGEEYWLVFHNFYVITRYNRSPLYARAVYELSQAIHDARNQKLAQKP